MAASWHFTGQRENAPATDVVRADHRWHRRASAPDRRRQRACAAVMVAGRQVHCALAWPAWAVATPLRDLRLVLVSPLGGVERQVLEWSGVPRRISWSPDGQWLAVSPASFRVQSDKGITLVSPITGERVEWAAIDASYVGSNEPAFSPDGRRIAFTRQRDDFSADVYVAPVGCRRASWRTSHGCSECRTCGQASGVDGRRPAPAPD